ncbi:MAG: hypothetical protein WCL44_11410 [bacterium]
MQSIDEFFEVSGTELPDDAKRVCPLTGNDEIKLCLDSRGAMHDFNPDQGSWPPPRIVWTGRRHARTNDRYNSNLFEWGFLDVRLEGEEGLGRVTGWRQSLHPRDGYVDTEITYAGGVTMRAESFVHLEKNVIVLHRRYEGLPRCAGGWHAKAVWTFCMVGTEEIPYRTTFAPTAPFGNGIAADTTADGVIMYRGRIALVASRPADSRAVGNRLEVEAPVAADGTVTFYLIMADDLGNDTQLLDTPLDDWMSLPVREINRELRATKVKKPDPSATVEQLRGWIAAKGYSGLRSEHVEAWKGYFNGITLELPAEERELRAILDTQLYTIRCSYSRYSLPANPFNSSWGAGYFWDEQFPMLGLMACGDMEMPRRILEWRRSCLPFSARMVSGYGARFPACATEAGQIIADRNGTNFYEFHVLGYIVVSAWLYCSYMDDDDVWRRYYPLIRECAEFFRHWLLVELPGNYAMIVPAIDVDESIAAYDDGPAMACGAALSLHLAAELVGKLDLDEPEAVEWRRMSKLASRLARDVGGSFYSEFGVARVPEPDEPADPRVVEWRRCRRMEHRRKRCGGHVIASVSGDPETVTEWAWNHLNEGYVLAGEGESKKALARLLEVPPLRLDFGALCESCSDDKSRIHHPWFTTVAGAYLRTITRMLLCSDDETIRLFPGLPAGAWKNTEFRLKAFGNIEVHCVVDGGLITVLELRRCSPGTRRCSVVIPCGYLAGGQKIAGSTGRAEGATRVFDLTVGAE